MINNETERELVVAAYHGTTGGYEATYSFDREPVSECKKYLEAIDALKVDGLVTVHPNYSNSASSTPNCSIIALTLYGIEYVENSELVDKATIVNHQNARKLLQELEEARQSRDVTTTSNLEAHFRQLDSNIQACARAYHYLTEIGTQE